MTKRQNIESLSGEQLLQLLIELEALKDRAETALLALLGAKSAG